MTTTPQLLMEQAQARSVRREVSVPAGHAVYFEYPATETERGTLVFVHGYRGNHFGLAAIVGALPEFRVLSLDLPGFGETPEFTGKHSVENYAVWLREVVAKIAPADAIIVAHSFGTIVTAKAAAEGLANRLVLINPVSMFKLNSTERFLKTCTDTFYALGGGLPSVLGNALLANPLMVRLMSEVLTKSKEKALREFVHRQHHLHFSEYSSRRVAVEGYHASVSASVAQFAELIGNSTLLIAAELDDITSLDNQKRVLPLFPNAQLRVIHGVGHLVHYETPVACAQLIREFAEGGHR
jgi:pimeloyl-ACP methyl ester carboxylesterase